MKSNSYSKVAVLSLFALVAGCGGGGGSSVEIGSEIEAQAAPLPEITWYSTVEPLIQTYCVACHTDGGDATFALETYDQVYSKLSALAYVLEADTMPPLGYTDLTSAEVNILLQWVADGAPEGDVSQKPLGEIDYGFTYHGDTRAIIEKYCVICHVDGGVAPFPLDSYEKVKKYAPTALAAVENGSMPPWPPTPGYTRLSHDLSLSGEDSFTLRNWLAGDLAEGNPEDYVPPEVVVNEKIDYNIEMPIPEPYTPTVRPDDHRCFVMDWPLDELAYVKSVNVIPDQLAEVHHVIVNIIDPKDTHYYKDAGGEDGRPGWYCLGSGGIEGAPLPRQIGGWVPGLGNGELPEGTGLGIEPGSLLVVQFHYNTLVADPTPDQSIIQIATEDSVERPASGFLFTDPDWLAPGGMPIPAGDPDVHHRVDFAAKLLALAFGSPANITISDSWAMHTGFLHMHNLGKTGRVTLVRTDGTEQVILDIRDWDFNWQSAYRLEREVLVKNGDVVRLECSWDNSAANQSIVNGVQEAPGYVEWGDGTGDEMCLTNFFMTTPKEGYDYSYSPSVHIETPVYRQRFAAGDLVPLELLFNNFSLHEPGAHGVAGHDDTAGSDHGGIYEGHYHVYLDTDDDAAAHVTAWDASYYYLLPEDIAPGTHQLRVSLRSTDHDALGIEQAVEIEVADNAAVEAVQLIDVDQWTMQSSADDSFSGHRPADVSCPDYSWGNEDGALEVETGYCNYLSLSQPSQTGLVKGDSLHLVLWHAALAFEQPAQAHVAIAIDGKTVWQEDVEIPTDAEIYDIRIPIDFDAPAGSKVEYHLHNHGYNSWTLLQLEVER